MLTPLLFAVLFVLFLVHQFYWRLKKYPPGPLPLPLVGNLLQLKWTKNWEQKFLEWRQEYGPTYTLWLGLDPVVTVNDYNELLETLVNDGDTYADRASIDALNRLVRGGNYGIIDSNGDLWKEQRRFTLRVLRDFGMGKNQMETRIMDELHTIFERLNAQVAAGQEDVDLCRLTDVAVGSVLNSVAVGYRYTTDGREGEFYEMKELSERIVSLFVDPVIGTLARSELLSSLPFVRKRLEPIVSAYKRIYSHLDEVIDQHLKQNDYSDESLEPHDFIDAFLLEQHKQNKKANNPHYYDRKQLHNLSFDLWLAGQESTSTKITWCIGFLVGHPEVQQKMHEELDRVIGSDRMIAMSDRLSLPYTNSVVLENLRITTVGLNVPRRTTRPVELAGRVLPVGTIVMPQVSAVCFDPQHFEKPHTFDPTRFLDEKGQLKRADQVVSFSVGKRQCPGESLARMEMFLFVANLLNQYHLTAGSIPPQLNPSGAQGNFVPARFTCRVEKRFK
ncbi:(pine wood nematode) hypothetical protein [Aphelenchoides fujianensis]|nr:(pine wood nematode) hypothetical protein [Aphelenchoides fujianensis]